MQHGGKVPEMAPKRRTATSFALAATAALALVAGATPAAQAAFGAPVAVAHQGHSWGEPPPDRKCGSACRADLERARLASAKYRDIVVALADGFVPVSPCEEGQGVHLLNLARFDAALSVTEPELLLYLPDSAGRLRLVGIEHAKPDDDGDLSTDHDRPALYGRPFDGPMLGHDPLHATPAHYDLHVWLWSDHPTGIFAKHNPALSCPGAGIAQHSGTPTRPGPRR